MTFAAGLTGALVLGYVALKLRLSPIVGYLVAGVMVGPFTPGYVADAGIAEQFAEIGVILLMFGIGLRFHVEELLAVWRIAVPGALIQSVISTTALAGLMHWQGWTWTSGLILGMAISVASTVVMALVLGAKHDLHAPIGHIAIGWTVVEDLLTVGLLLLLPIVFGPKAAAGEGTSAAAALGMAGLKVVGLVGLVLVLGKRPIPWALERIARTRSRELFTLAVLVLAVGIAVGAAGFFGVSMALGAFLAGLAVGRSEFGARAAGDAVPMRDAFAVLFFVSVGMLFNPKSLIESPLVIASVLFVVLLAKPVAAMVTVRLLGKPMAVALPVGAAFAQVGEFSFILGTVARELGILGDAGWNALVASSILSIAVNPAMYNFAKSLVGRPGSNTLAPSPKTTAVDPMRAILIGYGPVGRIVYRLLKSQGQTVTVIDLNLEAVRAMKTEGIEAVYGDVLRPGTLEDAGIARAGSLILSADIDDAAEIVRYARSLNPSLKVLARCNHVRDAAALRNAGATLVASGEAEVGVALAEAVTAREVSEGDRESTRARIRRSLYASHTLTE
jgi:monovalent cation:H+ antiporter-2, CPA2 family